MRQGIHKMAGIVYRNICTRYGLESLKLKIGYAPTHG